MKILDRYLVKHFLIPTIFCTITLIFLVLIADVFDNLDEFIKNHFTIREALRYYLNYIPLVYIQVIQWAAFLGLLFLLVNFNFHNELTAMKVSGLKINTIIRPLVFTGFLIGVLTFLVNDQIVPPTYRIVKRIQEERIELKKEKKERTIFHDVTYYGKSSRLYYAKTLYLRRKMMEDFIILWLDANKQTRKKTMAREATWNGETWELRHVTEFEVTPSGRMVDQPNTFDEKIYPEITESPQEFFKAAADTRMLAYRELKEYMKRLKDNGLQPFSELVDLNGRLSSPWNTLVVMFLCFPLLAKTATRKSIALNILTCLGLVFVFHVSTAIFTALGKSGKILPFLSVWINTFLFGFGSLFFLERADH